MAATGKLIPVSIADLPSLIRTVERLGGIKNTDAVNNLKNYKRYLEDHDTPKHIHYNVYALDNDWENDGLFLLQLQRAIFVYSMVDNNPRIRTALSLLDLENEHILAHFSSCHEEIIFATLDAMGLSEMYKYKLNNYYVCPVDRAARLSYKIPDNVVLQPLNLSHADQIIRYISFKSPMSDQLVRQAISFAPSLGAFCRFSGELMAWCLSYLNEAHSALAVRDEFQGRGLAKLLVRKIAHDRAVIEHKPSHCHIADGRAASEHVFKDAGFEIIATCYFGGKDGIIG